MRANKGGFTIVELLIVIVVIAILATISVVAYTGIQRRAQTSAILSEASQWKKLLIAYKAANGSYPLPVASGDPLTSGGPGVEALNAYCLGTGFPSVGGTAYCYSAASGGDWRVAETTGSYLITQLSTIGSPPANTTKYRFGNVTGPWLRYYGAHDVQVYTSFPSGTTCPAGMLTAWGDEVRQDCFFSLN